MNANFNRTSASTRVSAFFFAAVASAVVLGATVGGMQPDGATAPQMLALDSVTVAAARTN